MEVVVLRGGHEGFSSTKFAGDKLESLRWPDPKELNRRCENYRRQPEVVKQPTLLHQFVLICIWSGLMREAGSLETVERENVESKPKKRRDSKWAARPLRVRKSLSHSCGDFFDPYPTRPSTSVSNLVSGYALGRTQTRNCTKKSTIDIDKDFFARKLSWGKEKMRN